MTEIERLFNDHINLLRKIAWSFNKTTGMPFEDLFSEACLSFMTSAENYSPEKAEFSTFLTIKTTHHLIKYAKKEQKNKERIDLYAELDSVPSTTGELKAERKVDFEIWWNSLEEDVKEICTLILEAPSEFFLSPPKMVRGKIQRQLHEEKGFSWPQIWAGFKEARKAFAEI